MSTLLLALGWLTSSTSVFIKDVSRVVAIFIQFGFWLTPIFWNINMIPDKYQWVIKLNPMYYIVTGYRDSIVMQVPFWERVDIMVNFWIFTVIMMFIGIGVYRRLRPFFAEVI